MKGRARRVMRGSYLGGWVLVIGLLTGEVWLRGGRWLDREAAEAYTARNAFEQGRSAFVGGADELWQSLAPDHEAQQVR